MTDRRGVIAGLVFIVVGVAFLLDELDVVELRLAYLLPLALIVAGAWILLRGTRGGGRER